MIQFKYNPFVNPHEIMDLKKDLMAANITKKWHYCVWIEVHKTIYEVATHQIIKEKSLKPTKIQGTSYRNTKNSRMC